MLLNRKYNIAWCVGLHVYLASMHSAGWALALGGAKPGGRGMPAKAPEPQPSLGGAVGATPHCCSGTFSPLGCTDSWLNRANSSCCCADREPALALAFVAAVGLLPKFTDVDMIAGSIWVQSENMALFELKPVNGVGRSGLSLGNQE